MSILVWEKPERVLSVDEWKSLSADSAPPGVYTPNMSKEDRSKWKAKKVGFTTGQPQIEIRKDSTVIVVSLGNGYKYKGYKTVGVNLHIATAGAIQWTWDELDEFNQAVAEARAILEAYAEKP